MILSLAAAAREAGDRTALLAPEESYSFAGLASRVAPLVAWLHRKGLAPAGPDAPPRAVLTAAAEVPALLWLYALVEAGVPALLLHPRWTAAERRRVLAAAGDVIELPPELPGGPPGVVAPAVSPPDDHPLAVVYTSGSSGTPRGVVLSRRAFLAAAAASQANLGWREDDRWLLALAPAHVGGLSILVRCLLARRCVVLPGDRSPAALARTVAEQRVTVLSLVPAMLAALLDLEPSWRPPAHLRAVLLGGAAAPPPLLCRAADRGIPVLTTYGLTECCSQVATQAPGTVNRGELGAGPPLPGIEVAIRPDGAIAVRGPQLLLGYFPAGPQPLDADGWLITGDAGRLDTAGNLHVLGRLDDMIVTGGEQVAPLEVEAALLECPGVAATCVAGVSDPTWGHLVGALVVPASGAAPDLSDLRRHLSSRLAPFKHPRRLLLVAALPLNAAGKPDRAGAARLLADHSTTAR